MRKIKLSRIFFCCLTILLTANICYSQNLIALQNGSSHSYFTVLDSAVTQAQNGDTLYIPGGIFSLNTPISKRIFLIGVGHNPDSTVSTNKTLIANNIYIITGANGGMVSGLECYGIRFGNSPNNANVNDFIITRCNLGNFAGVNNTTSSTVPNNILLSENVVGNIYFQNSQEIVLRNNIVTGSLTINNNVVGSCYLANNIFLFNSSNSLKDCKFENNIFFTQAATYLNASFCVFNNNIFLFNDNSFLTGSNIGMNNIFGQSQSSIFVSQTGNSFSYTHNYQLQASYVGNNGGTDGTDIGIYGGSSPWKEGSVLFNPHVQFKSISGSTNPNGNLPINIKVAAQNN